MSYKKFQELAKIKLRLKEMNEAQIDELLKRVKSNDKLSDRPEKAVSQEEFSRALIYSVFYYPEAIEPLIKAGADVHFLPRQKDEGRYDLSPFLVAALYRPEALRIILQLKKDDIRFDLPNSKCNQNVMHLVAAVGSVKCANYLIQAGADINVLDLEKSNPLHYAAYNRNFNMVALLLNRGTQAEAQNNFGNTPFHYAVKSKDLEICKLIWEHSSGKKIKNGSGFTPEELYRELTNKELPIAEWKEEKRQKLLYFRQLCEMNNNPR